MNKNEITTKLYELNEYLDVLEDLIEHDFEVKRIFRKDLSSQDFNISAIEYDKNLVKKGFIVLLEDSYFRPWQLKIYCEDYPYSQQFEYDCREFDYTDNEKQSYAHDHETKIKECEIAENNILIEIEKIKTEINILTDNLELIS